MNEKEKMIKVNMLLEAIRTYNTAYRSGRPLISDSQYDALIAELRDIDPDNAWLKRIEPAQVKPSRSVKLPIPMKSLDKATDLHEVRSFIKKCGLKPSEEILVMPKYDGVSLLTDMGGRAYSRGGDSNEGQDCTPHYRMLPNGAEKQMLPFIYGELVFSVDKWNEHFEGRVSDKGSKFKSPRNTAAGLLNRDEASELLRHADFMRYGTDSESISDFDRFSDFLDRLNQHYGQNAPYAVLKSSELNDEKVLDELYYRWKEMHFIDGLVLYVNDIRKWEELGRHETSGNPQYATAFKSKRYTLVAEAEVEGIEWRISKSGAFKPVVIIEKIDMGDCEIDSPTGYNAKFVMSNRIAKGAKVRITRSGCVIPKIVSVAKPAPIEEVEAERKRLDTCPHCGSAVTWNETRVELKCTNPECPGTRLQKMIHFFVTMGIKGVGAFTIAKLFFCGYDTIAKILNLTADETCRIQGVSSAMAFRLEEWCRKIKRGAELETLMAASPCFDGMGRETATKLLREMSPPVRAAFIGQRWCPDTSPEKVSAMSAAEKKLVLGVGDFYQFLADIGVEPVYDGGIGKVDAYGPMRGMTFLFTGFRDKKLEEGIIVSGGTVKRTMSKGVKYLVVKTPYFENSKTEAARRAGVKILTADELKSMLNM